MDVNELTPEIWRSLHDRSASQPRHVAAEVLTWQSVAEPFASVFVSQDSSLHLIVAISEEPELSGTSGLRGLQVQVLRDHAVLGRPRQDYLDLRCTTPALLLPYTRAIQDTALLVLRDGAAPADALRVVLDAWRAFWSPPARPPLSENAQRGLIGELLVLDQLLTRSPHAVDGWAGPDEDRHDFRFLAAAIEVKTSLGLPRRHHISSLHQLMPSPGIPLWLVSVVLEKTQNGPITLLRCIQRIASRLDATARASFNAKLAGIGYSPLHDSEYEEFSYTSLATLMFQVSDSFPRITEDSFIQPLPSEVESVSYVLNLQAMAGSDFSDVLPGIPL